MAEKLPSNGKSSLSKYPPTARQETYSAAENISLSKRPNRLPSYSSASLFSISLLHKLEKKKKKKRKPPLNWPPSTL